MEKIINRLTLNNLPNLLIYGIADNYKISLKILNRLYKNYILSPKIIEFTIQDKKYDYHVSVDKYHYEITPSNYKYQDFNVLSDFISKVGNTKNISNNSFKLIIVHNSQDLTQKAQFSLKRTLEVQNNTLRFIFLTSHICNITSAIRSRCLTLRNPLKGIELKKFKKDKDDVDVLQIYKMIISYKKLTDLLTIRNYLYTLIPRNIDITKIFRGLVHLLIITKFPKNLQLKENKIKRKIINYGQKYEQNMKNGNNDIFHIEAFIFNVVRLLF
jgi:hypothetical protein